MADKVPKGSNRARPYPPNRERFFLGPYTADQVAQEVLAAVRRIVDRFQEARRSAFQRRDQFAGPMVDP